MNNDLISRERLKNTILLGNYDTQSKILSAIDNAPTVDIKDELAGAYNEGYMCGSREAEKARPQGEWVPVSERLPEEKINPNTNDFVEVLCSTVFGNVRVYKYGKPMGYSKAHFWDWGEIMDEYIIAWQPLPEPYKEVGAE